MLFEFFRVIANCYFLFISLLQVSTTWSPTNKYTTAGPLLVVLAVSMVKQGLEDLKRHEADNRQNAQKCRVLSPNGEIVVREWKQLQVGDVLVLSDRDEAPADIFILSTSEEEGRCFIETCNLDGETNLKRRNAIECVAQCIGYRSLNDPPIPELALCRAIAAFRASIQYELPNNRLYNFTGRIEILASGDGKSETAPIGPSNIILRGCSVRGCTYTFGAVIFTGSETKIMQNARATPSKQSNVYRIVNRCILLVFTTQFILCLISTICSAIWVDKYESRMWYLGALASDKGTSNSFVSFFTFLILYNNLVPISLYVSLDMVKVTQAKYISNDPRMEHNGKTALARTSDLNEELGQVQHIFSDKTGTLTQNIMEFRKCFIAGISYGFGTTEIGRAVTALAKKSASTSGKVAADANEEKNDPREAQIHFNPKIHFDDPRLIDTLNKGGRDAEMIDDFLTVLSVCHTVIPEKNERDGSIDYRASSPDEEALVKAAKCLGYDFLTPAPVVDVKITKKSGASCVRQYTILNVNEFNSTRKRMSVVARTPDQRYFLFCKGADNVMLPRSKRDVHTTLLTEELKRFASEGLRTLVLCTKEISESDYHTWDNKYHDAVTSLTDRDRLLEEVAEEIEVDMNVVGATAIEDKLQDGVPNTIFNLANAGIKIWMLTGDKEETAINIAHACRLINDEMRLVFINREHLPDLIQQMEQAYQIPKVQEYIKTGSVSTHLAIVCDGKAMVHIFPPANSSNEVKGVAAELASKLVAITSVCQAVVACRVSPAQKADIVNLVRYRSKGKKVITLAIGDGANDVNMIQSAHVGVGISGQEGVQAVNASDYAIAQFRFLERLLLVHGRFNYQRITKVILYSFYKNVALVIALFLFNFYNGQSGTSVFESFVMAGWNFFLALPIIAIGVFDEDVSSQQALAHPSLYLAGQRNEGLNVQRFAAWIVNAIIQALLCFLLTVYGTIDVGGLGVGLYLQGSVVYSVLLMSANLKVVLETQSWTKFNRIFLAFSLLLFIFFLLMYPLLGDLGRDMLGVSLRMLGR